MGVKLCCILQFGSKTVPLTQRTIVQLESCCGRPGGPGCGVKAFLTPRARIRSRSLAWDLVFSCGIPSLWERNPDVRHSKARQSTAPHLLKPSPSFIHQPTTADLSLAALGRAWRARWMALSAPMPDASTRGEPHRWMGLDAPLPGAYSTQGVILPLGWVLVLLFIRYIMKNSHPCMGSQSLSWKLIGIL